MPKSPKPVRSLTVGELRLVEFAFCRFSNRWRWCRSTTDSNAAVSRTAAAFAFLRDLIRARLSLGHALKTGIERPTINDYFELLRVHELQEREESAGRNSAKPISRSQLASLLSKPVDNARRELTPRQMAALMRYILLGAKWNDPFTLDLAQIRCVDRIVRFFFPATPTLLSRLDRQAEEKPQPDGEYFFPIYAADSDERPDCDRIDFFHPDVARIDGPARTSEAIAEIVAMSLACDSSVIAQSADDLRRARSGHGSIIRTSGRSRFFATHPDSQTPSRSGLATVGALKSGAVVKYLFPRGEGGLVTAAESSARGFLESVSQYLSDDERCRLELIECGLADVRNGRWSGEGLSGILRFVLHRYTMNPVLDETLRRLEEVEKEELGEPLPVPANPSRRAEVIDGPGGVCSGGRESMIDDGVAVPDHPQAHSIWARPRQHIYLIMSRAPKFGPCVWNPELEEIRSFSEWADSFTAS